MEVDFGTSPRYGYRAIKLLNQLVPPMHLQPNTHLSMLASMGLFLMTFSALAQPPLPAGEGKAIAETACAQCHSLLLVAISGHSREDWGKTVERMVSVGAKVSSNDVPVLLDYLAKNLPERPQPPAALVAGNAKVTIREWPVLTAGAFPHDPLAAPDGSIWYTGYFANLLGRVDPKSGEVKEYRLKTPDSGPHGLVADKSGNIWFTANSKGYIGKLDIKTEEITEYKLPVEARDPHTPIFDSRGILWFTVQSANLVGRLDPKTGDVKVVSSPTPKSNPYGIQMNSKGIPFFVEFGSNKVASIDPQTMQIREYVLPNAEARPRRLAITQDDSIWYSDYSRGYLGRLDPGTGKVTEWPSPGGPQSQPYGITAIDGVIWYSESNVKPNTLVRFDPKGAKFQTWVIPSSGGVVRNMMPTRDGNLVMACSGVGKVALVELR